MFVDGNKFAQCREQKIYLRIAISVSHYEWEHVRQCSFKKNSAEQSLVSVSGLMIWSIIWNDWKLIVVYEGLSEPN